MTAVSHRAAHSTGPSAAESQAHLRPQHHVKVARGVLVNHGAPGVGGARTVPRVHSGHRRVLLLQTQYSCADRVGVARREADLLPGRGEPIQRGQSFRLQIGRSYRLQAGTKPRQRRHRLWQIGPAAQQTLLDQLRDQQMGVSLLAQPRPWLGHRERGNLLRRSAHDPARRFGERCRRHRRAGPARGSWRWRAKGVAGRNLCAAGDRRRGQMRGQHQRKPGMEAGVLGQA